MRPATLLAAALAALLALAPLAPLARAGMLEDCNQENDLGLIIGGCTEVIGSGQLQGKRLAWVLYNRATAYFYLRDHALAIADYDQALRLDPGYARAYNGRAVVYSALGEHARAIENYDRAVRLDPGYYNNRAWALYLLGRNAEALVDVERALSRDPRDIDIIDTRGHVLAALGRPGEARGAFERAMRVGRAKTVRKYQRALAAHGYYRGAIDGSYGPKTRAALVACLEAGCRVLE